MGRADIGSSHHTPARIHPQRGKVAQHSVESSNSKHWAVLNECVSGSYLANDASEFAPEAGSLAGDAGALSGCADVLTGKPARYHVNNASPWSSVKGPNVVPYRERREQAVILSGEQYACGIGVVLDGADGAPSEQVAAEYSSTSAREKCQLTHHSPAASTAPSGSAPVPLLLPPA
jgi:hypothetical protein